ncbi:hypothetical protein N9L52_07670 [Litoricolaceae bacterium]|nr:hypothetical protein [Litorivicinaceae bacterium]
MQRFFMGHADVQTKISFLAIVLVCFSPIFWWEPGYYILGSDLDYSFDSIERFWERFFLWDTVLLGGVDRTNNVASLPFIGLLALIQRVFGLEFGQIVFFSLILLFNALSFRFLLSQVVPGDFKLKQLLFFIATVFVIGSIYNCFLWLRLNINTVSLGFICLFWGGAMRFLNNPRRKVKEDFLLFVVLVGSGASIGIQPPLIFNLIIFSIILFFPINGLRSSFRYLARLVLWMGLFTCCSLFWILPLAAFIGFNFNDPSLGATHYSVETLLGWVSDRTSLITVLTGIADAPWLSSWGGMWYWEYGENLRHDVLFSLAASIILFFTLVGLTESIGRNQSRWALIFLLSSFLSMGIHFPFNELYAFLIEYVPGFWIQRAPWQKFAMFSLISQGVLICIGAKKLLGLAWEFNK